MSTSAQKEMEQSIITRHAYVKGLQDGAVAGVVSGAGVYAANKYSPWFKKSFNASSKTAIVTMAALGVFTFTSHDLLTQGVMNPKGYLERINHLPSSSTTSKKTTLQPHHRFANFIYDHPFKFLTYTATPLVGYIFWEQSKNKGIQLSQQIMHTRVIGQGSVIFLLLSTMAFHDYIAKHGKYEE